MRLLPAVLAAALVSACASTPAAVRGTFQAEGLPRVDVTLGIRSDHASEAERYRTAAFATLQTLGTWLAPYPDATISVTVEPSRWWTAPAAMAPEYAAARAIAHAWWMRLVDTRALPPGFVDGLADYAARRALSKIVDQRYLVVARSRLEGRYFGGFVPRDLRVPLRVEDQGDPVGTGAPAARVLLTLGTLERWVSTAVFDAILVEFVRASAGSAPGLDDFAAVASRVSGQDLSWLFDETLKSGGRFDYAVESLDTASQEDGTYRTKVTVKRVGDAVFGRGLPVRVVFADGGTVTDTWNGPSDRQTFEYRSPSPAVSAEIDPDRTLLLDVDRGNNGITLEEGPARSAAIRWTARWLIWFEDALLTSIAFT